MGNLDANLDRLAALEGMGCSRKRREDPRFIQGKGTYVDDIKMPGMLFGVMVRSPYAHARVKKIDKSRALAHPGVHAVLTADDLKPLKLHWMPTLAGDVQAPTIAMWRRTRRNWSKWNTKNCPRWSIRSRHSQRTRR
jgi:carbon-monoxide dehydrogenase large subunit